MSDSINDLFIASLKDIKEDIRQLDNKMDQMHQILTQNTTVLEEHEKRSTSSESRITTLENKDQARSEATAKIKGFFMYAGIIISALGSLGAVFHYWIQPFLGK